MPPKISVVAYVDSYDAALVDLVKSIDAQSLSYRDFELIFLVAEAETTLRGRLEQLARYRPNVEARLSEGDWSEALVSVSGEVAAPLVLPLAPRVNGGVARLHAEGLQRLSDFLQDHQCDLVAARASSPAKATPIPAFFRHDQAPAEPRFLTAIVGNSIFGYRSEFVRRNGLVLDTSSAQKISEITDRIGILGSCPIVAQYGGPDSATPGGEPAVATPGETFTGVSASWREGGIRFATESLTTKEPMTVHLSILHAASGVEYWLPTTTEETRGWDLDVRSAALGGPLADGRWTVMINAYGDGDTPLLRSPFPARHLTTGLVDGKLIAPTDVDGAFVIDVGATRVPGVPHLDLDHVQITEDARGPLLTAQLPDVHTAGSSMVDGVVILDRLKLPARLYPDKKGARLECYVSGLAGERVLVTKFGASPAAPTGLSLVISPVGRLSVIETPTVPQAAGPPAERTPADSKSSPLIHPRGTVLSRVRHAVPDPLEPVAQRLRRNRLARRIYRKLT